MIWAGPEPLFVEKSPLGTEANELFNIQLRVAGLTIAPDHNLMSPVPDVINLFFELVISKFAKPPVLKN